MTNRYDTAVALTGVEAPPGQFVTAVGVPIHYVRWGAGPPVVYIHGAKGSVYDFLLSIGGRLALRYTAVACDRPGSGFSGRATQDGGSPQTQAAVLRAAAAALGLERPLLVGHSFGAAVALAWALDAPGEVAAVVTLSGYVLPLGGPPPWVLALMRSRTTLRAVGRLGRSGLGRPLVDGALRRAFFPGRPPEDYARIAPALALDEARLVSDRDDRESAEAGLRALRPRYARLDAPVVVVVGEQDRIVPPSTSEKLQALLPRAEIVRLPGSGHMPQFTDPDAVLAAVDRAADLGGV
ncbi:MAG: alpha/beta hydrolase [Actinobacteria bacterium]|nr:alpha/beta hydrolase [Actinomycetota bacterium]